MQGDLLATLDRLAGVACERMDALVLGSYIE
jgi:hypothetical protein